MCRSRLRLLTICLYVLAKEVKPNGRVKLERMSEKKSQKTLLESRADIDTLM